MNKIYFENHQKIIFEELNGARKEVLISVAWLNFNVYKLLFSKLVIEGVKIKVIVNDDYINNRYEDTLNYLESLGIQIKKIKMLSSRNYMHHKFCIVDNKKLLIGSFNWSKNAQSNYENLLVLEDGNVIYGAYNEFNHLWSHNKLHAKAQKKLKCNTCKSVKYNLLILKDHNYHTKYKVVSVCECENYYQETSGYFGISLYNSIIGVFENYNDQIEYVKESPEQIDIIEQEYEYDLTRLFSSLIENVSIHGVALLKYDIHSQDGDGEWMTRVIWKHRFAYDMQMEYFHTFDMK